MHNLKPYFIDFSLALFALTCRKIAIISGITVEVGYWKLDKIMYCMVMFITGFTTLYRFIKDERKDKKHKHKIDAQSKEEKEKENN